MRPRRRALAASSGALVAVALLAGALACSRDRGVRRHAPLPSGEAEEGGPAFQPPTAVVDEPVAASTHAATVVGVRVSTQRDYDRVVVELEGAVPGRRVTWLPAAPRRCGSGEAAPVAGRAWLELRLDPAQAHDAQGHLTLRERALTPRLPAIGALAVTCDFEGVVTWAIGAPARRPFRVLTLVDPPRVVLDVAHAAAPPGP